MSARDFECSNNVSKMIEYGRFGEEYIVYGFTYLSEDKLWYKLSSDIEKIYTEALELKQKGVIVSPIHNLLKRMAVPAGQKEDIILKQKITLAQELKKRYSVECFKLLMDNYNNIITNNTGASILHFLKKKYEGYYNVDQLVIFEELMNHFWKNKQLDENNYSLFNLWLLKTKKQMEGDFINLDNYQITFYGCSYLLPTGEKAFEINGQREKLLDKIERYEQKGYIVTPVYHKTYSFSNYSLMQNIKTDFYNMLVSIYSDTYWNCIVKQHDDNRYKNRQQFKDNILRIESIGSKDDITLMNSYLTRWQAVR